MKIGHIDFNGKEMTEIIKSYENIYYILTFEKINNIYRVLRFNLEDRNIEELFSFEGFVLCKVDVKNDNLYITGKRNNFLLTYKIKEDKSSFFLKVDIRNVNNVLDFFVFDGFLFFLFQTHGYKQIVGYLYHERYGFLEIKDNTFLNSINTPLFIQKETDYMIIEEFYIKDFDFSFLLFDEADESILVNNIYYIEFKTFIKNILLNLEQKYNILRSNKGLNYITILGEKNNNVILFEKEEDEYNLLIEIDLEKKEIANEIKTKMFFIEQRDFFKEKYFIAYDLEDAQIIFDSNLKQIFKWDRGILNSYFNFCLLYKNRFVVFKNYNELHSTSVYNIFDINNHTSVALSTNFLILDDDCVV